MVNNLPNIAINLSFGLGPGGVLGDAVAFGLLSQDYWGCHRQHCGVAVGHS